VVRVIVERGGEIKQVAPSLPTPVTQVIEQIQSEIRSSEPGLARARPSRPTPRSTTRVVRGYQGLKPRSTSTSRSGGDDKVMKLARRLKGLIHLAERGRRGEARGGVRMAEDTKEARAEGQGVREATRGLAEPLDIDRLGQDVLEVVQRELEIRRERRLEDPDESDIWW
jgi:hypothetical protein